MTSSITHSFPRSLEIGESAFSTLIQDTIPVWPDMYEVLYAYESGQHSEIKLAIDQLKDLNGQLDPDEIVKIHQDFFGDEKLLNVSEDIGLKISDEIRKIVSAMDVAGEKSVECDLALRKIETKFSSISSPNQLHSVVSILSDITRAMADNNQNLNTKLKRSTQQIEVLHKDLENARDESNTDALTGLPNRKKFDTELRRAFEPTNESEGKLCLLLLDIDHFKKFNDTYGHQTGDQILRLVAQTLKKGLKGRDLPARYGGEEFGVVLPGTTSDNAFTVAEQVREAIAAKELIKRSTGENLGRLTVSIGVAEATPNDNPSSLVERADKALYRAKDTGRNRCVIAPKDILEKLTQIAS